MRRYGPIQQKLEVLKGWQDLSASKFDRYLTVRVLYPKAGHASDILEAVKQISEAASKFEGLVEIGAWMDKENDRIVNISLWESKEKAVKATDQMHPMFSNIPWNKWERQPALNFLNLFRLA